MKLHQALIALPLACALLGGAASARAESWQETAKKANAARDAGDIDKAMGLYRQLTRQNIPYGMTQLGILYLYKKKDAKNAYLWCRIGSNYGHAADFACLGESKAALSPAQITEVESAAAKCKANKFKTCGF